MHDHQTRTLVPSLRLEASQLLPLPYRHAANGPHLPRLQRADSQARNRSAMWSPRQLRAQLRQLPHLRLLRSALALVLYRPASLLDHPRTTALAGPQVLRLPVIVAHTHAGGVFGLAG